jgi:hypothetical protein
VNRQRTGGNRRNSSVSQPPVCKPRENAPVLNNGQRKTEIRNPKNRAHPIAVELPFKFRRSARQMPRGGASGARTVIGGSLAELPGDPTRARKKRTETELVALRRWGLAVVCRMVVKLGRQRAVTSLGFLSIVVFLRAKESETRSISLLDPTKDTLRFGDVSAFRSENPGDFCRFWRIAGL